MSGITRLLSAFPAAPTTGLLTFPAQDDRQLLGTLTCRWADTVVAELVAAANSRPLLSGFYRMLTTVIRIADQAGLLQPVTAAAPAEGEVCHQVHLLLLSMHITRHTSAR